MNDAGDMIEIAPNRRLPTAQVVFTFARSGGPGGQNVNKVNSKATLTIRLDDLARVLPHWAMARLSLTAGRYLTQDAVQISAEDSRSQHANRAACLERLREVVVQALARPKPRRTTRPSRGSVERRLESKRRQGERKAQRRHFEP